MWSSGPLRSARWAAAFLGMTLVLLAGVAFPADQEGCLLCHRLGLRIAPDGVGRPLDVRDAPGGSHGTLYCSDCHPDARTIPHAVSPGPSRCIGECHGTPAGSGSSHRRAAFGGLTETHRNVAYPRPPCLACHAYGDARGESAAVDGRCVACHRNEGLAVRKGPNWRMSRASGGCVGCHPAHPQGAAGKTPANCAGTGCHPRTTPGMRAIVDHRGAESDTGIWAKGVLFLAIAVAAWGFGGTTRPRGGTEGSPE